MTDVTDSGDVTGVAATAAVDAGPVPSHLVAAVSGDALEGGDGDERPVTGASVDAARASGAIDAGPPPDELVLLASDADDDRASRSMSQRANGE